MAKQPIVTTDLEDEYIKNGLSKLLESMKRDRSKHVTGSAIYKAMSDSINEVQSILTRFGG